MNKLAIYGAGAFGKIFYKCLNKKIDFFIDDFSSMVMLFDIPIKKIEQIPKETIIYISVLQDSVKIENQLLQKGFKNIINFTNSVKKMPNILKELSNSDYLWLVKDRYRMLDESKLLEFKTFLFDKKSKNILDQIINLRKTLDIKYYIEPSDSEYFPTDVPILDNLLEINFIDCGAYTGDTIDKLMTYNKNVNYCISFEPDIKNLNKLNNQLEILNRVHPKTNFFVYPSGVYSSNKILNFSNKGVNSSAALVESSDTNIFVVSLDNVILNSNPNYIKMDIEGAEKEAILGAQKTIKKYKPNLAICLYHKPEDLWEIPFLIKSIEPTYDMYLRVHEDMGLSTVLYCISKKRSENV
jgi:FkbM family methyltransferase